MFNSSNFPVLFFVGFVLFAVVLGVRGYLQAKKRREVLASWAAKLGLRYSKDKDYGFDDLYPEFRVLRQGDDRYAYNIVEGDYEGRYVTAFDYHYETTSGTGEDRQETSHYFSAVIVEANIRLKPMVIRPERFFDSIANFFGHNDLDFESAEFSKRYHVSADDRQWAYEVLHARTIDYLLQRPTHSIEMTPTRVMIMRSEQTLHPDQLHQAIRIVDHLLDELPDYVRERQALA